MRDFYQLSTTAETFVVKNFEKLNIHEFTTVVLFYLRGGANGEHDGAVSKLLLDRILNKIESAASSFNELQLSLFLKSLIGFAVRNRSRFDRVIFEPAVNMID